ncbi:hypothetical protein [Legionella sp. km772]|uniref:hypothetical protein n=1 Tax=Legionella sp. km772 TaxID=2498111 RepID=UPI000F8E64C5|nr:hypothetical protein [Legionella sp. km772]RUR06513.1 hypothetical protein ELY15_13120 [Legionella sp. km772]
MPGKDSINPIDVQKTTTVVAFFNVTMMPIVPRLGVGPSSLILGLGFYALHQLGKNKQAGSGWVPGLFSSKPSDSFERETLIRNICTGGARVYDEFIPPKI